MPTYQYRCPACSHSFEEFQSITDDPIEVCPNCQGKTHRVIFREHIDRFLREETVGQTLGARLLKHRGDAASPGHPNGESSAGWRAADASAQLQTSQKLSSGPKPGRQSDGGVLPGRAEPAIGVSLAARRDGVAGIVRRFFGGYPT
jgi:putative FmdB family regulatory protein